MAGKARLGMAGYGWAGKDRGSFSGESEDDMAMDYGLEPITPYAEPDGEGSTSGWSGSDASHERALERDASGKTQKLQRQVMRLLSISGYHGITIKDLRDRYLPDVHHGNLSAALSNLHKAGLILRLEEKRDRCQIYVLPELADGRPAVAHGRAKRVEEPDLPVLTVQTGASALGVGMAIIRALREHGRITVEVE